MKAVLFFKSLKVEKLKTYTLLPAIPSVEEAKLIAEQASNLFTTEAVDTVELIGTKFISMLRSKVENTAYLPANVVTEEPEVVQRHNGEFASVKAKPIRLFEPSIMDVMTTELLPKYLQNVIYQALLEAAAAEIKRRG